MSINLQSGLADKINMSVCITKTKFHAFFECINFPLHVPQTIYNSVQHLMMNVLMNDEWIP